jgi:hypothetical protein
VPKSGKRVNGDGSVYRRGAGWEAAITVAGTRRTERAKTKAEAEAALRRLRAQRDTGTLPRRDDTTTGEFLTSWLALRKPFLRYSTWRRYSELVAKALPVIGGLPLTTLRGVHLQNVYARTRSSGLSEQTVLSLHRVLHAALADAERWDYVVTSVARKVKAPVVRTVPPEVLSPEQVRLLLQQAPGHPLGALFTLAVTTGMRQGELLGPSASPRRRSPVGRWRSSPSPGRPCWPTAVSRPPCAWLPGARGPSQIWSSPTTRGCRSTPPASVDCFGPSCAASGWTSSRSATCGTHLPPCT